MKISDKQKKNLIIYSGVIAVISVGAIILFGWRGLFITSNMVIALIISFFQDNRNRNQNINYAQRETFRKTYYALVAMLLNIDNRNVSAEIKYFKSYLKDEYGDLGLKEGNKYLNKYLKMRLDIVKICDGMKRRPHTEKLQMIHQLFKMASVDKNITEKEEAFIHDVANKIGILAINYRKVKAMFVKVEEKKYSYNQSYSKSFSKIDQDKNSAYSILGISKTATADEIKRAYHAMAFKYHPDRFYHLGETAGQEANEMFQKIQYAYQLIKK